MSRLSRFGLFVFSVSALAAAPAAERQAATILGRLPLRFEQNQGQWTGDVRYAAHAGAYTLQLHPRGSSLTLDGHTVEMSLLGARRAAKIEGLEPVATRTDYYMGARDRWRTNVPTFSRVRYNGVYPGVDVVYYGNRSQLEYDFVLGPGADPRSIRMRFRGADSIRIAANGDLVVDGMVQKRPLIYQDGPRREIAGEYVLLGRNTVGVKVGDYDRSRPLVIDPVLTYLSYLGGSSTDRINCAKVVGNRLFIAGQTANADLSATGSAYAATSGGFADIFVAVIDITPGAGFPVTYFTYLGGSNNDYPLAMDVDAKGVIYLGGATSSTNFPLGGAVPQTTGAANSVDGFVLQLYPDVGGTDALLFSTYLGGASGDDQVNGIAIGPDGMAYVIGTTKASDFPVTADAYQGSQWGPSDAFIARLDPVAGKIVYSTYLGGEGNDDGRAILVDPKGLVYFAGSTLSDNFPMAGFQVFGARIGAQDGVAGVMDLTKAADKGLIYSTFFGGTGNDEVRAMSFDANGRIILAGYTLSTDMQVTPDAMQNRNGGNGDAFVAVLDPALPFARGLVYATYFGGSHGEVAYGVAGDKAGNIYLTGYTLSSDLPVAGSVPQADWGAGIDVFVASIKPGVIGRGALNYSTYLGGSGTYVPTALALGADGSVYVTGYGNSGLPMTENANQGPAGGVSDGFIAVLK
jgi:hypothetical protein